MAEKKKRKFGWKEVVLLLVLAAVVTVFVFVFIGNKTTIEFVSVGGEFDAGEGAKVYDYPHDVEGTQNTLHNYYELLTKSYRISSVATLPEVKREGFDFLGWYVAEVGADGSLTYSEEAFSAKQVKTLEKDGKITLYAKWQKSETTESSEMELFKPQKESVLAALDITWKGMLGIFIVIGLIFVVIVLLNAITNKELPFGLEKLRQKYKAKKQAEANQAEEVAPEEGTPTEEK